MATSGTKTLEFDVADYIEEAYERCGLEARTGYDARTARRSIALLLADWANRGHNRWTIDQATLSLTSGTSSGTLGAETIDVLNMAVRDNSKDTMLTRMSREDYLALYDKSLPGTPTQFYVDRQINPVVHVWPVPNADMDLVYDRLVRMDDVTHSSQTIDVPFRFYPAFAAGLAYYLSIKKAPDRTALLKQLYEEEYTRAALEDRDRASLFILPGKGYGR